MTNEKTKTMTAEEVAEAVKKLRRMIATSFQGAMADGLLDDLAAQAARVPGLEEQVSCLEDDLANARDDVATNQRLIAREAEKRMDAESERDAAQHEVERLGGYVEKLKLDVSGHVGTIHEQHDTVSTLRERVATLENSVMAERETANDYRHRWAREGKRSVLAEARVRELEAKVGKLEADNRVLESHRDTMQVERNRGLDYQKVLRQRFDTARNDALEEAATRVDTEAQESHTREIASVLDDVARRIRGLKIQPTFPSASQPPPVPTQVWSRGDVDPTKEMTVLRSALFTLRGLVNAPPDYGHTDVVMEANSLLRKMREATPTPPPGLREAVLAAVNAERPGLDVGGYRSDAVHTACDNIENRIRVALAAYDATGGEVDETDGPKGRDLVTLREALVRIFPGVRWAWSAIPSLLLSIDSQRAENSEDAAKYRAAVGRLNDRAGQAKAAHDAWGSDPEGAVVRWLLYGEGGAPAPRETLDKARVVEVLSVHWYTPVAANVAHALGLTLATPPSGPGGGEKVLETHEDCGGTGGPDGRCKPCEGTGMMESRSPTPPSGMLEAVGHVLAAHEAVLSAAPATLNDARDTRHRAVESLRAAYNATGGEHGPDATCPNCKADHEDAAKYRAAVERLEHERKAGAERNHWDYAHVILTGDVPADAQSPAPRETLDKARVVEVLRELADAADRESGDGPVTSQIKGAAWGARRIAERLGLTLGTPPSGPGGGEDWPLPPHDRCEMKCMVGKPQECAGPEMAGIRDGVRARIAPAPTPPNPSTASNSSPSVAWEGDGVRVLADGTPHIQHDSGDWTLTSNRRIHTLARALAEAKREVATLKAAADGELKATDADRGNASLAWGCAGSLQTALRRERANRMEFAKKAAESMRERAKAVILKQQATEEDGPTSDDNGYAFNMLLRLADEIGKLPLE